MAGKRDSQPRLLVSAGGKGDSVVHRDLLLVEDNPDDEALTIRALKRADLADSVTVARDGADALDYLFGSGDAGLDELPVVVLLDLHLPKLDGLDVLKNIRADARTARLPVVILTSSDEECDVERAYKLGANSYVRKPVDFAQFTKTVAELGLYWLRVNRPPVGHGSS